jgi:hypothetical protein
VRALFSILILFLQVTILEASCDQKIAALGWHLSGPEFLLDGWKGDGPEMPIEFNRLTSYGQVKIGLTIQSGSPAVPVFWKPIDDFSSSSKVVPSSSIVVDLSNPIVLQSRISESELEALRNWARENGISRVVLSGALTKWDETTLRGVLSNSPYPPQLQEFLPFSPDRALRFINYANRVDWSFALRRIQTAPDQFRTPFRQLLRVRRGL